MNPFKYHRAENLQRAKDQQNLDENAKYLAGGMTLLPAMKHGLIQPSQLIDISTIVELGEIQVDAESVTIGAATQHDRVATSSSVQKEIPGLTYLASQIGDAQVRVRGTLGGSLANNDPAADYPAATLALKGQIITDRRTIEAEDFFTGFYATALEDGEIIRKVRFIKPVQSAYAKFKQAASGYALAGVFVAMYPNQEVRVAVTGVGQGVFRWLAAEKHYSDSSQVIDLPLENLITDLHATSKYRAHLAKVLFNRAATQIKQYT